jgi:hypothetical protein
MRTLLAILILTFVALPVAAATYKWVDKDGKVHYSDHPPPGVSEAKLPAITEVPASATPEASAEPASTPPPEQEEDAPVTYTELRMTSPTADQTLRGVEGVSFSAAVTPNLGKGDRLAYELDGQRVEPTVSPIYRGSHTVRALVLGPDDTEKIASDRVTFYVHQPIARPPTKKAPPKNTTPPPP